MAQYRYVRPLDEGRFRGLTTSRLLAYQRRMLRLCATRNEDCGQVDPHPTFGLIRSKDDPRWGELRELVRSVLGEREHV